MNMKRCAIVIHSENGNCLIMAKCLQEALSERSVDARLYRVDDNDLHIRANKSETVNESYEDIVSLSPATIEHLEKADMIILGCPTRFGNVTAEMKTFLDTTADLTETRALEDKFFACFTSCSHSTCEGSHALDSMVYWAQSHGMLHIPYGYHKELASADQPVAGIVHLAGPNCSIRPNDRLEKALISYADTLASFIQE